LTDRIGDINRSLLEPAAIAARRDDLLASDVDQDRAVGSATRARDRTLDALSGSAPQHIRGRHVRHFDLQQRIARG
jgi:hypothetical protein